MIDFKKLHSIFVEEAMEKTVELEDGLLQLEKAPDDKELLNVIFRSAHTIKGSSASLGLQDISRFTHHMEEVLDLMRQGKLAPSKGAINVLLEANDLIKEMVECITSEASFDFNRCENAIKNIRTIIEQPFIAGPGAAGQFPPPEVVSLPDRNVSTRRSEAAGDFCPGETARLYKILFVPDPDMFKRGIDPSIIIDDLKEIGTIEDIKACTDNVPALSELNHEHLYLRWDIFLKTEKNEQEIKKVFEFVEDGSEIIIFPVTAPGRDLPPIGRMLVDEGIVKPEDVATALREQKKLGEILVEQGKVASSDLEDVLKKQRNRKADSLKNSISSTIRVDIAKLDHLINTVGEMVIIHSMFQQLIQGNGNGGNMPERLDLIFSQLQRIGKNIQESSMSLRMLPVGEVFQRFTRLVRELAESKNKDIELIITGEETELDKGVLEKITDPLVHLIRNAMDHGIETPEERAAKGKPKKGTVHLSAYQMGDSVYIEVEDDGKGLNKEKIVEKAISKGIISSASGLTDEQIYNMIFLPGFSTADKVTDISGRGVGMDVVKKNIDALNGKVYVRTKTDLGTTMSIKLPLTLAIIDGLKVLVGEEVFIIPITSVLESLRPPKDDVKTFTGKGEVINVRGEFIPLIRLHKELGLTPWKTDPWEAIVVLVAYENKRRCLLVDELVGEQQVVIKNLGAATPKIPEISGGTILGDGKVALVLDVPGIIETSLN